MLTSLRARLSLVYLGLIVLGYGGLTLYAGSQIARGIYAEYGNRLRITALQTADMLAREGDELDEHFEEHAERIARQLDSALTGLNADAALFDTRGRLLYSAAQPRSTLQPGADVNFVIRTSTDGTPTLYTAAPLQGEHGTVGYLQLGVPVAAQQAAVRQVWLALAGGFVAFAGVGLLASLWLLNSLTRPLQTLRATALAMADGHLDRRVPPLPQDEVATVASAFNEMADRVEALVAEQRAFASNASHELRTPLTTVRLRSEALLGGDLDDAVAQQYIREIDSEVQRLAKLVDDLMLLSRLDARRLTVSDEQVDVARLLTSVVHALQPLARARGVQVTADAAPDLPPASASFSHLQIVLRNLLDNGIKYTPAGGRVYATLERHAGGLRFTVSDSGIGIAADALPEVGKRFYRVDKARNRQTPGSGLGLALVISIVHLYGGSFTMRSAGLGQGTTAQVDWPLATPRDLATHR